jgi:hypothetical protein
VERRLARDIQALGGSPASNRTTPFELTLALGRLLF